MLQIEKTLLPYAKARLGLERMLATLDVGAKICSENVLARKTGLSRPTIRKAIAELVAEGVLCARRGSGTYLVRKPAPEESDSRTLAREFRQGDAVAVICDLEHLNTHYRAPSTDFLLKRMMTAAREAGISSHFMVGGGADAEEFIASLNPDSAVWREIRGIIALAWKEGMEDFFLRQGIPSVIISYWRQGRNSVTFDYRALVDVAAAELVAAAARKVCVVHNLVGAKPDWDLHAGLRRALDRRGSSLMTVPFATYSPSPDTGFELARQAAAVLPECDALFITDDNLAEGVARYLEAHPAPNLKTILTHATRNAPPFFPPAFRRISFDLTELTAAAVSLLKQLRNAGPDPAAENMILIKPTLERAT